MKYRLVYTHRAAKDIRRFDPAVKRRIGRTLLRYQDEPLQHAEPLTDFSLGSWRFMIGDYRVVFDIEDSDIVILRVGHRKEIYRLL